MSMVCVPDPYPGALEVLVVEDVPRRRPNVLLHHFHLVLTRKFDGPRESSLACEQLQEPVGRTRSRFSLCRQGDRGCVLFLAGAFAAAFRCLFLALSILVRAQAYLASGGSPLCTRFWASIRGVALCPSIAELSSFLRRMEESTPLSRVILVRKLVLHLSNIHRFLGPLVGCVSFRRVCCRLAFLSFLFPVPGWGSHTGLCPQRRLHVGHRRFCTL